MYAIRSYYDMIFAAHSLTVPQMALLIREGSGIVCLVLSRARCVV